MLVTRRALLISAASTALIGCKKRPPELLYVSAEASGEVIVVDPSRGEIVARIAVGKRPRGLKISRDGKLLYVALSGSPRGGPNVDESTLPPADRAADGVGVVELAGRKLLRTLPSGQDPETFDLSRDGKTLFISNEETSELSALDLAQGQVKQRAQVGAEPEGVTVRPDGKVIYVTSEAENAVAVVDATTLAVITRVPTGLRPRSVVFMPNSSLAFVTNELAATVSIIDAEKHTVISTIKLEAKSGPPHKPMGAVLSHDARRLFVTTGRGAAVVMIDIASKTHSGTIDGVGARPWGIVLSRDGQRLYTANGPSDDISIIDLQTAKVERRIKVGGMPWGLAVSVV